ncbi:MAG: sugar ABC transporter permease [Elusimicrobiota bacterium]
MKKSNRNVFTSIHEYVYKRKKLRLWLTGMAFLAPNVLGFLVFVFIPILISFGLAFCEWDILTPAKFVGLKNFSDILTRGEFWEYLYNTFYFMLSIPIGMAISLALALALNQKMRGVVLFRTIYFLPVVCTIIASAIVWRWIYNPDYGLINGFIRSLRIPVVVMGTDNFVMQFIYDAITSWNSWVSNPPTWLTSTTWSKPAIIIMQVWHSAGYNMLLYLAALQSIPAALYEAAEIDGANERAKFWYITLPSLSFVNFFIIIMGIIGGFQAFGVQYVMTGGGPAGSTTTIVYYIYNNAFQWFKMGYASAIAWILFVLMLGATLLQWRMGKGYANAE